MSLTFLAVFCHILRWWTDGGLLQKSQVIGNWPGLKKSQRFEGKDLNAKIDTRAAHASVMGYIFDRDHKFMCEKAFYGAVMPDVTKAIFG
jgi:uncharacterized protein (DUF1501 family)